VETQNGKQNMIRLAIVILNWNGVDFLRRYLPSVMENSQGDHIKIWVADNGSTDNSLAYLRECHPEVGLLEFDSNHGFAGGYNKALSMIKSEYYILLNSDATVTAGWTEPLLRLMENDPRTAACMPKIRDMTRTGYFEHAGAAGGYIDFLGYPFCRGRIFDMVEPDGGQYDDEREIFWASGACMMVRAEDWHHSGGFDETFFAHMEEIDLCWRLKSNGRKVMVCPSSVIYHLGGGTLPQLHPRKTFFNFRNSLLMLLKNLPQGKLYLLIVRLVFDWLSVIKFIFSLSFANAFAVIRAHFAFFRLFPDYLDKRKKLHGNSSVVKTSHKEIYPRSIVVDFFLLNRKLYSRLGE
jgi:GT2 family glycosyltransferase